MLEAIREHAQGKLAQLILVLITIPFALWGIDSYINDGGRAPALATVDGDEIAQNDFLRAVKNQRDAMEKQLGAKVDIDKPAFREDVLKQLVNVRLIVGAANSNGIHAPADEIDRMIQTVPIFQVNGKFSKDAFNAWLRNQGMSPKELVRLLQDDAVTQRVQFGYGEGAIVPSLAAERLAGLLAQQREVNEVVFDAKDYLKSVAIDDKAVAAEYESHKADFTTPAQVRLQYLVLSAEALRNKIVIDDATAKQFYTANLPRYQGTEQRSASHILIKTSAGMPEADRKAAKAKAEQVYMEVVGKPAGFAALAKQHSQDPGSAANGGSLGSFTRDMMVKPFADAVFGMKPGEIKGPVESEFGYHIIRLDGVTPGEQRSFESVKGEIVQELAQEQAQRGFNEQAERFSNLVYEKPDSLEPAATELKLTIQESGWVDRTRAEPRFLMNPQLIDAVFAADALEKHQNTEAIEVAPATLVAARVLEHKPAGTRPLAEVANDIRARLTARAALAMAIEAGKQATQTLQTAQTVPGLGVPMTVSRMQPLNLPLESIKAIFKADRSKLPATVGVETPQGYRVYRVNKVVDAKPDENRGKMMRRDLGRMLSQEELKAYLEYRRANAKIEINTKALEKKAE